LIEKTFPWGLPPRKPPGRGAEAAKKHRLRTKSGLKPEKV